MKLKKSLIVIGLPVAFAFLIRLLFGVEEWGSLFTVMTISFLFFLPFGVGALTIYLSSDENVENRGYRILAPWIPILIFFVLTLLLAIEGWACWLMVLPLFLGASSVGGLIAANFKRNKKRRSERLNVSIMLFLPFLVSPVEQWIGAVPGSYKAYTVIDIHASKETIWNNVTRVKQIESEQDKGWLTQFLGFPRPIKAELDYEGVGAKREAIFDKGLVFHEEVKTYEHQKKMTFSIKAVPYEIPSTTMDEHVVIGGNYFDVLDGTYELEKLDETTYRLHLYSHFKINTTFNFYASWWAEWIMKDIQNNILQVVKERAEKK